MDFDMKKIVFLLLLSIGAMAQSSVETPENEFVSWFNSFNADSSRVVVTDSAYASPVGEIARMYVVYNLTKSKALFFQNGKLQEIEPMAGIRCEAVLDYRGRVLSAPEPFRVWSLNGEKMITVVWQPCHNCHMKLNYSSVGFNKNN